MNPKLEETIVVDFTTHSPTTGGVSDADATPTAEVFEDSSDTAILTPTVVKRTGKTGNYRVSIACTAANGFETGKSYNVVASATVGAVTGKGVVRSFQLRTRSTDDVLPTGSYTAPPSAASIRSEIDSNSTKLDATISSRLAPTVPGRTLTVAATGEADANLSTTAIAAIWAYVVTGAITAVQLMRGFAAVLMGKSSGHESNAPKYRDLGDTKNVIDAATDANGNRTTVTRDLA